MTQHQRFFIAFLILILNNLVTQIEAQEIILNNFQDSNESDDYYNYLISESDNKIRKDEEISTEKVNTDEDVTTTTEVMDIDKTITEKNVETEGSKILNACPQDKSALTKRDLKTLIDYVAMNELNIVENINSSYYKHAISVRDHQIKSLEELRKIFTERPLHLKDILDDMAQTRFKELTPIVEDIVYKFKDFASIKNLFNEKYDKSRTALDQLENYKKICALACDDLKSIKLTLRSQSGKIENSIEEIINENEEELYHCAILGELYKTINTRLSAFMTEFITKITLQVDNYSKNNAKNLTILRKVMKEKALNQFGIIMYDILSLQDEFHHFLKEVNNNNITTQLSDITKKYYEIDYLLKTLEDKIENYRQHCLNCFNKQKPRNKRDIPSNIKEQHHEEIVIPEETHSNIVDELLINKMNEIKHLFEIQETDIFDVANNISHNQDNIIEDILNSLKPFQGEIIDEFKKEEQEFETIRNKLPKELFLNLSNLNIKVSELLSELRDANEFINNYIDN